MSHTEEAANRPFPYEMLTSYYRDKYKKSSILFRIWLIISAYVQETPI